MHQLDNRNEISGSDCTIASTFCSSVLRSSLVVCWAGPRVTAGDIGEWLEEEEVSIVGEDVVECSVETEIAGAGACSGTEAEEI